MGSFPEPSYAHACTSMEWTLHHGLKEWDDLLMRGITPSQTASLSWLPPGEPRRLFIAGGSDAHGDLNYHRRRLHPRPNPDRRHGDRQAA